MEGKCIFLFSPHLAKRVFTTFSYFNLLSKAFYSTTSQTKRLTDIVFEKITEVVCEDMVKFACLALDEGISIN